MSDELNGSAERDDHGTDGGPSRRRLLAAIGAGAVGGTAGCGSDRGESTGETPTDGEATGTTGTTAAADATASATGDAGATPPAGADGTPLPVAEGGPPSGEGWSLTFRDEFDEGELDWDTWEVGFGPSNQKSCAAAACAIEENVHVDAETDRLVLTTTPEGADEIPNSTWLADYTTGAVTTGMDFAQTFGYFEAKAKIPAQPGGLPAFWAWGEDGNPPEIDFYEVFGESPRSVTTTIHLGCGEDDELQGFGTTSDLDHRVDERFQIVGCEWGPDHVAWYLDGRELYRVRARVYTRCHEPEPLFPICNTHVGGREGDFLGPDDVGDPAAADYPYTHEFEWVRVWQREDWA